MIVKTQIYVRKSVTSKLDVSLASSIKRFMKLLRRRGPHSRKSLSCGRADR